MFDPGTEASGPAARHVHPADHGVLATDVAHEVDGAVDEHPPVIRVLALVEQLHTRVDTDLGAPSTSSASCSPVRPSKMAKVRRSSARMTQQHIRAFLTWAD